MASKNNSKVREEKYELEEEKHEVSISIVGFLTEDYRAWIAMRLFFTVWCTHNMLQADQWWQNSEVAYAWIFGNPSN